MWIRIILTVLLLGTILFADPGDLDLSFGGDGKVTTDVGGSNDKDQANSIAIQSDGKIIVAGWSEGSIHDDFALVRYDVNGSLDLSFNGNGKVTTQVRNDSSFANSIAIQSDGKIVAAGYSYYPTNDDFALVRYDVNGSLDSSFGTGGIVTTDVGGKQDIVYGVAIQSDGRIVVAGYSRDVSLRYDFALARYLPNGDLDPSFGTGGKVTTDMGCSTNVAQSIAIQSDGKIIAAGYCKNGSTSTDFALARYNTNGSPDPTFGTGGKVFTETGSRSDIFSVVVQDDGKIVAAGGSNINVYNDFALIRYNTNGNLDLTFGTNGKAITAVGTSNDEARSISIQNDGKIVVTGFSDDGTGNDYKNFAIVRYLSDGSLDTSFGTSGKVTTDMDNNSEAYGVAIQEDGKIVSAGVSGVNTSDDNFALVRYQGDPRMVLSPIYYLLGM